MMALDTTLNKILESKLSFKQEMAITVNGLQTTVAADVWSMIRESFHMMKRLLFL